MQEHMPFATAATAAPHDTYEYYTRKQDSKHQHQPMKRHQPGELKQPDRLKQQDVPKDQPVLKQTSNDVLKALKSRLWKDTSNAAAADLT